MRILVPVLLGLFLAAPSGAVEPAKPAPAKKPEKTAVAPKPAAKPAQAPAKSTPKKTDSAKPAPKPIATPAAAAPKRPPLAPTRATLSADDRAIALVALNAAEAGKWDAARAAAQRAQSDLPLRIVTWLWLQRPGNGATFRDYVNFLGNHRDWPFQDGLQRRAEEALDDRTADAEIVAWFADRTPLTGEGAFRYGEALLRLGHADQGLRVLRDAWANGNFSSRDESELFRRYETALDADLHWQRLDRLLWERQTDAARRMLPRVEPDRRRLAEARLALIQRTGNIDALIAAVPARLQRDAGLIYERLRFRRERGIIDATDELLLVPDSEIARAERWWTERHALVRRALNEGRHADAYRLAANHGPLDNRSLVEAEWLAGWIALRFVSEPTKAVDHFVNVFKAARFPVSKARAAYWLGRSAEVLNEPERATQWYAEAAQHATTFYGQLSLARLGRTGPFGLPRDPPLAQAVIAEFNQRSMVRATRALAELGQADRLRAFILRLQDTAEKPVEHAMVAQLAREIGRLDLGVAAAKRSHQRGVLLLDGAFPVVDGLLRDVGPERAIVLALSRQESEFNQFAISRAGARGLMQLMPATAQEVARGLGLPFDQNRLLTDADYNARLGGRYLATLIDRYDGNLVLAFAAYNAGEGRVRRWIREFGDPRWENVDVVDWVEMIPFSETRNYVQRVLEGVQVYRYRLSPADFRMALAADMRGRLAREASAAPQSAVR